jgi:hypothetical protein
MGSNTEKSNIKKDIINEAKKLIAIDLWGK